MFGQQANPPKRPIDDFPGIMFHCRTNPKIGLSPDPCIAITAEAVKLARDGKMPLVLLGPPADEVRRQTVEKGFPIEKTLVIRIELEGSGKAPEQYET
jgi:hypothetical protein